MTPEETPMSDQGPDVDGLDVHGGHPYVPPVYDDQGQCRVCEFVSEAEATRLALVDMRTDRDRWRDARKSDHEAEAIEGCVRVLERFLERSKHTSAGGFTVTVMPAGQAESAGRVLRYLADRFGVTWYTPPAVTTLEASDA